MVVEILAFLPKWSVAAVGEGYILQTDERDYVDLVLESE
jgi:hypothetical protein